MDQPAPPWWQTAVLYQVYPRSFADSNGDGVGDLPGLIGHLDHLAWLGVEGIWLSPVTVSPNADWGYDVSDFCAIAPEFGTLEDFDTLITEARSRGMRVVMDIVPNHTSDQHPWFLDARSSRQAPHRSWYVWGDPGPDGALPNNWVSSFGGPAWTLDEGTGQFFLHNHLSEQPDLNWWDDEVRDTFDGIFGFWADRGVAGFRIDVCNIIIKDKELRDNPPATEEDDFEAQMFGQRSVYNANRPEVHEVLRRWRHLSDQRADPFMLLGETPVPVDQLARYYGAGDELHLAFNFNFISADFNVEAMRAIVESTEAALPAGAWPAWTGSNHDMFRFPTRWAADVPARVRVALLMVLALRGTPVLYQGDEIGMPNATGLTHEDMRDPLGVRYWPYYEGRDAGRTPMHWRDRPGGGFTDAAVTPWLPLGDVGATNVEAQRHDPDSLLTLARDLIAFRRGCPGFTLGDYRSLATPDGVWAWARGPEHVVVLNLSDAPTRLDGIEGTVAIATDRRRDGETVAGAVGLRPDEGLIVRRS